MSYIPDNRIWRSGVYYETNAIVKYGNNLYSCTYEHLSTTAFTDGNWQSIDKPILNRNLFDVTAQDSDFEGDLASSNPFSQISVTLNNKIPTGAITYNSATSSITTFGKTSTTGTIDGNYSLQTSIASGTITAGHGFLAGVSVPADSRGKVLSINFSYSAVAGSSLMNFSGTSSNTWAVYIYDWNNSQWIQPSGAYNIIQGSGVGEYSGTFQTASNTTAIRLAIICINPNTSGAVDMRWDNFYIGKKSLSYGAAISDWTSYTPTVTHSSGGATNVTHTGRWRRVGDSIEVMGTSTFSAASAAFNEFFVALPSGLTFDTSKLSSSGSLSPVLGTSFVYDAGATLFAPGNAVYRTSTIIDIRTPSTVAGTNPVNVATNTITNTFPITFGNGDTISWQFKAPITGWSSNSVMSSDTDTRVVAVSKASGTQISVPTSTYAYLDFTTLNVDTHSAWRSGVSYNSATGAWTTSPAYVVPVSGIYGITCGVFFPATGGSKQLLITKNGSNIGNGANDTPTTSGASINASVIHNFNAGDLIQIAVWQNSGSASTVPGSISAAWSHLEIQRLSGPATITATETVAFSVGKTGSMSVANQAAEGSEIKITSWDSAAIDTHGSWSSANSSYTIPVSGTYLLIGKILKNTTTTAGMAIILKPFKNGSTIDYRFARFDATNAVTTNNITIGNSNIYKFVAGDVIDLRIFQNSGVSQTFSDCQFTLTRIGN
jgi:hypothetical protein